MKNNFPWTSVILFAIITFLIILNMVKDSRLADKDAEVTHADSMSYHVSKRVMEENSMLREKVGDCDKLKGDVLNWVSRAANAWDRERHGYWRQISERDSIIIDLRKRIQ